MTKKCPYCGEHLPDNSLNCPKCYHEIPREDKSTGKTDTAWQGVPDSRAPSVKKYSKALVLILALIPAAFGIMGMAQIYEGRTKKGLKFLCVGLPIFIIMCLCGAAVFNGGWGAILFVGLFFISGIAFIITYIVQALDAYARTLFKF